VSFYLTVEADARFGLLDLQTPAPGGNVLLRISQRSTSNNLCFDQHASKQLGRFPDRLHRQKTLAQGAIQPVGRDELIA
jgi:hypothetical protein